MSDLVLSALSLYRFYHAGPEETLALRGVTLEVPARRMVAVVGPSGSGKSTLLACLCGLDDPDGGTVTVGGERLSRRDEATRTRIRRDRIGMLTQGGSLLPHLTVEQNLRTVSRLAGPGGDSLRRISELLDIVGLVHRQDAYPDQLSGGEVARAGIAAALVNDPRLLIADEPTAELDSGTETAVLELLRQLATRGAAVVVASHSPAVVEAADDVLRLRDGVAA